MQTHAKDVLIGSAMGFALIAAGAHAQDNDTNAAPGPVSASPPENVIVVAPPIGRNRFGAPIVDVSVSRTIRLDDLDLKTDRGMRRLSNRIQFTATALCNWLNAMYPINNDQSDSGPWVQASGCYRNAVRNAWQQADGAIRSARGGTYAGYGSYGGYDGP